MAMSKIKALQIWCKRTLEGYRDVNITDMTTSWRSGLAFCAMIHKYRPDLIDYDSLDKENVYENNKLAFDVAEKELSIAALLEASDMVAMKVPDKLSIITYVAQYHNYFKDKPVLGGPGISVANKMVTPGSGTKRHHEGSEPLSRPEVKRFTPAQQNKQDQAEEKPKHHRVASMGETCKICREKVYLLERHIEDGTLYHRSCFRRSNLSPSSKVYAKPSVLSGRDDRTKDRSVSGMTALGKGFAAPEKSEPERSKSPALRQTRVSLDMNSETPQRPGRNIDSSANSKNHNSKTKSVLDKIEERHSSDWRSKRSQSPKSEDKSGTPRVDRPSDFPGNLGKINERRLEDKWPPSKESTSTSRTGRGAKEERSTPVPKPRQSLLKDNASHTRTNGTNSSHGEQPMDVDEQFSVSAKSRRNDNPLKEDRQTKRTEARKLPLVLQSNHTDKTEETNEKHHSKKTNGHISSLKTEDTSMLATSGKGEVKSTAEPSPRGKLYLKKNDQKINGSTEKLNKTVGERIKESKAKTKLKSDDVKTSKDTKSNPLISDRTKSKSPSLSSPAEVSTPPPLPRSTPPGLPKSPPPQPEVPSSAPPRPARTPAVTTPSIATQRSGPPKPPRSYVTEQTVSPKSETVDMEVAVTKASRWTPGEEPVAVIMYPSTTPAETESDQRVLGGLLKSLANVRQRQPDITSPSDETKSSVTTATKSHTPYSTDKNVSSHTDTNVISNNLKNNYIKISKDRDNNTTASHISKNKTEKANSKPEVINTTPIPAWQKEVARRKAEKDNKSKERPKSTAAILDFQAGNDVTSNKEEKNRGTSVTDTTPTPQWQKEAKRRKDNNKKQARPRSMDVLTDENGEFSIGEDNLKVLKDLKQERRKAKVSAESEETIPDWQKEAQKRMEARKGNFVDPEKKRIIPDKLENGEKKEGVKNVIDKSSRTQLEVHENGQVQERRVQTKTGRTKVSPGVKFNFDDNSSLDSSNEMSPREDKYKHRRPPPPRPKSPPPVNRAQKHQRYSTGTPNKHTPPRPGLSPGKLSPMEIQRQLLDIDSKLTDLELKGRRLEDSIRNAQEDEEDNLMIDWFLLVSQKNELVRQEADLIYASRENELEAEQDSVQDQLRQLLDKPNKTKADKEEEEFLLGKLLDIVDQRSNIIDSIDDDKHRYEEEDREIAIVLEKKGFGASSS